MVWPAQTALLQSHLAAAALDDARVKDTVFISKWVDYSNKYGLGYQLTDGSVGVLFNDGTKMVLSPDQMCACRLDVHVD